MNLRCAGVLEAALDVNNPCTLTNVEIDQALLASRPGTRIDFEFDLVISLQQYDISTSFRLLCNELYCVELL